MCFNSTTSIIAFAIGMISVLYFLITKQYYFSTFLFVISFIQLLEYFAHKSITNNNEKMNERTSICIYITNVLQPLICMIVLFYCVPEGATLSYQNTKMKILYLLAIYIPISIIYGYIIWRDNKFKISSLGKCERICKLNWNFYNYKIKFCLLFLFLYLFTWYLSNYNYKDNNLLNITTNFNTILLVILLIFLSSIDKLNNAIMYGGSIWCFMAVFSGPIIILGQYLNTQRD